MFCWEEITTIWDSRSLSIKMCLLERGWRSRTRSLSSATVAYTSLVYVCIWLFQCVFTSVWCICISLHMRKCVLQWDVCIHVCLGKCSCLQDYVCFSSSLSCNAASVSSPLWHFCRFLCAFLCPSVILSFSRCHCPKTPSCLLLVENNYL